MNSCRQLIYFYNPLRTTKGTAITNVKKVQKRPTKTENTLANMQRSENSDLSCLHAKVHVKELFKLTTTKLIKTKIKT